MYLKRILVGFLSSFIFLSVANVNALNIKEEQIDNFYLKDNSTNEVYNFMLYKNNDEFIYSLELKKGLSHDVFYSTSQGLAEYLNISTDVLKNIQYYIYFGYGYLEHTDIKWYVLTQYLIYKEKSLNISIIDEDGIDILIKYKPELDELKNLIANYKILPSYFMASEININYGEEYLLEDNNNVENLYAIVSSTPVKIITKNNSKYLSSKKPGKAKLLAEKLMSRQTINYLYYNKENIFINRADLPLNITSIPINIHGVGIRIQNIDENEKILDGSIFSLYNSKDEKVYSFCPRSNGFTSIRYFPLDSYYLIQEKVVDGYKKIDGRIEVAANDFETTDIVLVNETIKSKVKIYLGYKYLNNNNINYETGVSFGIFKDNEIIYSGTTNDKGYLEFLLPKGEYILKQLTSSLDFSLQDDIKIIIDGTEDKVFNFMNIKEEYLIDINLNGVKDLKYKEIIEEIFFIGMDNKKIVIKDYLIIDNKLSFKTNVSEGAYKFVIKFKGYFVSEPIEITINSDVDSYDIFIKEKNDNKVITNTIKETIIKTTDSDDKEDYLVLDVPATGISIRPYFVILAIVLLITSLVLNVKK